MILEPPNLKVNWVSLLIKIIIFIDFSSSVKQFNFKYCDRWWGIRISKSNVYFKGIVTKCIENNINQSKYTLLGILSQGTHFNKYLLIFILFL